MIFPWQHNQWQQLLHAKQVNQLPHALLFSGIAGTGKVQFASSFARALLCQAPEAGEINHSCQCHSCRLMEGRAHPNVLWVEPEKAGQAIKVDQIREASDFIYQSALQGKYRIVLINPANEMNINASNALLKTLEEPPPGAIIILISHQSSYLPATILSRCQRINFPRPNDEDALKWLQHELKDSAVDHRLLLSLAHGAPLAALNLNQDDIFSARKDLFDDLCLLKQKQGDPIKSAAKIQDTDPLQTIDFALSFITDLLRLQLGSELKDISNRDYESQLIELKQQTCMDQNTQLMDYLQNLRAQICGGINLNKQLMIENLLIRWMESPSCF